MTERELFDTYKREVYLTCYHLLQNKEDAEDVCHDVFIIVFRRNWQEIEHIKAWILRITVNQCMNVLRKRKLRQNKQLILNGQYQYEAKQTENTKTVEGIVIQQSEASHLIHLMKHLSDKLYHVLVLRFYNDLSLAAIGHILEIPEGTVKSRIYKGLRLLRKELARQEERSMKEDQVYGTYRA